MERGRPYRRLTGTIRTGPVVPAISSTGGVVNEASFQPGISPGSWITISGTNLPPKPDNWTIVNGALPITLDGVSVSVGGQPAYIEYISSAQINALAPNVPAGSVPVIVTNANGASQAVNAQLAADTPAFFQWGNYAVATHQDYSYAVKNGTLTGLTTVPAAPGDVIRRALPDRGPDSGIAHEQRLSCGRDHFWRAIPANDVNNCLAVGLALAIVCSPSALHRGHLLPDTI